MENDIRDRRAALILTQAELAKALGVSRQTVISIESGRYVPSLPVAFKLSRFFGVPVEAIFRASDEGKPDE